MPLPSKKEKKEFFCKRISIVFSPSVPTFCLFILFADQAICFIYRLRLLLPPPPPTLWNKLNFLKTCTFHLLLFFGSSLPFSADIIVSTEKKRVRLWESQLPLATYFLRCSKRRIEWGAIFFSTVDRAATHRHWRGFLSLFFFFFTKQHKNSSAIR